MFFKFQSASLVNYNNRIFPWEKKKLVTTVLRYSKMGHKCCGRKILKYGLVV